MPSKPIRNKVAGYISRLKKRQETQALKEPKNAPVVVEEAIA